MQSTSFFLLHMILCFVLSFTVTNTDGHIHTLPVYFVYDDYVKKKSYELCKGKF